MDTIYKKVGSECKIVEKFYEIELNCDLKIAFVRIHYFDDVIYDANLVSTFNFVDAFWQMSLICFAKFSFKSKFIPNNFLHKKFFMYKLPIFKVV